MVNQFPYTNVHELNLDWIIKRVKELEKEVSEIEDYAPQIADLRTELTKIKSSINVINRTLTALNGRCNALEDGLEVANQKISDLRALLFAEMTNLQAELNSVETLYYTLRAYNDTSNTVIYNRACKYADDKFREFVQWVEDPKLWLIISPITGRLETVQQVINDLYEYLSWGSLTAAQFDALEFDCNYLDGIGFTCADFDFYGRFALYFSQSFVTESDLIEYVKRSELDNYALKTDLEPLATKEDILIYNPLSGIKGAAQQTINALASLHQCGNNCYTLDGLEYTANQLDGLGIDAYTFDFKGIIKTCGLYTDPTTGEREELQLILNNIVGLLTMGLTASQTEGMSIDAETFDGLNLDAYTLDYIGLRAFMDAGYLTVLTGITAEQYQNILVGNYGILHTI